MHSSFDFLYSLLYSLGLFQLANERALLASFYDPRKIALSELVDIN